jgi:hypothetical protein
VRGLFAPHQAPRGIGINGQIDSGPRPSLDVGKFQRQKVLKLRDGAAVSDFQFVLQARIIIWVMSAEAHASWLGLKVSFEIRVVLLGSDIT